jgi:Family of unknown function (DUF6152)
MNKRQVGALTALAILSATLLGTPASAHHSAAMFDHNKVVPLAGAVKEWKWMNPHGWIQVVAPGPAGLVQKETS